MNRFSCLAKSSNLLLVKKDEKEVEDSCKFTNYIEEHELSFNYDNEINITEQIYHSPVSSQRDVINNIIIMETNTTLLIEVATKRGVISLWSGSNLSQSVGPSYYLPVGGGGSSRNSSWLCDAVYMKNSKIIAYALSDRSLHFYDTSSSLRSDAVQEHRHLWKLAGLTHTITCLYYHELNETSSILFMGNEQGTIIRLTFIQSNTVLFQRRGIESRSGQLETVFWQEIIGQNSLHSQYVQVHIDKKIHLEAVVKILYDPDQQVIMSCSMGNKKSLILSHKTGKMPSYVFNIEEGVRCFDFDSICQEIATGSDDGIIRIWNPLVTSRPTACLTSHETAVIDVLYTTHSHILLSLCKYAELRLWNTRHLFCLQTIQLNLPTVQQWWSTIQCLIIKNQQQILISLGGKLVEITITNENMTISNDSTSSSDREILYREEITENQSIISSPSDTLSNSPPPPIMKSLNPPNLIQQSSLVIPQMNFNLPSTSFQKPTYPPSALEVLKFCDDEDEIESHPAGMNERIEQQTRILAERRHLVEQCAPHLALSLWPPSIIHKK